MSYPRRDHRLPPIAPGDTPRQTPIDTIPTTNEDLGPTGEHMMELSGSDLEVEELDEQPGREGPTLAATPRAVRPVQAEVPGPGPGPGPYTPQAEYGVPEAGPVTHSPSPLFPDEAQGIDPMAETIPPEAPYDLAEPALDVEAGDGAEPLDNAPTRIEREEDIRASFEGAPAHGPRLLIIGGNNRGHEHPLKMADNSIGRGVDNDVILADIAVSRKHTLVCYEGTNFVVRDLGSGNGTLLNGQRVDSCPLKDGDQLELGNTLLRFVNPLEEELGQAALAQMETRVSARAEEAVQLTADVRPRAADAGVTRRERRGPLMDKLASLVDTRPKKLMVFGGLALVVLFGTLIALKAVMSSKKQQAQQRQLTKPAQPPDELAAREFTEGIAQYRARNWERAREHFLKVVQLVPSADHAKRYADQAAAEITARNALKRAKNSLTAKDFDTARRELAKVHSTSEYGSEAQALKQKVDDQQLSQLLETVKTLKGAGDVDGARAKLKQAQEIAPTNPEVLKLAAELRGKAVAVRPPGHRRPVHRPAPRPTARPTPRPTPRTPRPTPRTPGDSGSIRIRSSGKLKNALALYRKQEWGPAYGEAKSNAEGQRGRAKQTAEALAKAIYEVGKNWIRADRARDGASKVRYYEVALKHDRKIQRGPHQAALKKLIVGAAKAAAASAITRRDYRKAAAAVKVAERYGAKDPVIAKAKQTLEKKGMELFTRGYTVRTTKPATARKLWRQVLAIIPNPATSAAYKKAYEWLNNTSPSYQDEDED